MRSHPRLLLLSNSLPYGRGFLDHAEEELRAFLAGARRIAFVPFAAHDLDAYAQKMRERMGRMGFEVLSLHHLPGALDSADAVFVGGGNTFRLLHRLYERDLLEPIRTAVNRGMPYVGSSAGSIVAGPTIKTTKDMPVVQPLSFDAFGFLDFHISPHYLDPDPGSKHMGETQEERIGHFLEENDGRVVGLREGSLLRVENASVELLGPSSARLFQRGAPPWECPPGRLSWPEPAGVRRQG